MRSARVYMNDEPAGILEEQTSGGYVFRYHESYSGPPVSLSMPISRRAYSFEEFPPFFEGLLPEGEMLEGLLRQRKIDRTDLLSQLLAVGGELVGAVTVAEESQ